MMLSLDTAYRSFGGEVEASGTPTICRLPDSRRHQLSAIAPCRERIGSLPLHHSIARHLIFALLPTFAVSHGDVPHALSPARAHWSPRIRNYCGAVMGIQRERYAQNVGQVADTASKTPLGKGDKIPAGNRRRAALSRVCVSRRKTLVASAWTNLTGGRLRPIGM